MPLSTNQTSALRKPLSITFNGDAYEIYLEPRDSIVVMDKILRFANNQNVTGVEVDFFQLDRPCRRKIIREINKVFKKTILPKTKLNG